MDPFDSNDISTDNSEKKWWEDGDKIGAIGASTVVIALLVVFVTVIIWLVVTILGALV